MSVKKSVVAFGILTLAFAVFSLVASSFPDGLEATAEKLGFMDRSVEPHFFAPAPDYVLRGIKNEKLAGVAAGILGAFLVFAVLALALKGFAAVGKSKAAQG